MLMPLAIPLMGCIQHTLLEIHFTRSIHLSIGILDAIAFLFTAIHGNLCPGEKGRDEIQISAKDSDVMRTFSIFIPIAFLSLKS